MKFILQMFPGFPDGALDSAQAAAQDIRDLFQLQLILITQQKSLSGLRMEF